MTWERPALSRLTDRVRERSGRAADPAHDDQRGLHAWLRRAPVIPLAELHPEAFHQIPVPSRWDPGDLTRLAERVRLREPGLSGGDPADVRPVGRLEAGMDGWRLVPIPREEVVSIVGLGVVLLPFGVAAWGSTLALLHVGITVLRLGEPVAALVEVGLTGILLGGLGWGAWWARGLARPFSIGVRGVARGDARVAWDRIVDVTRVGDALEFVALDGMIVTSPALTEDERAAIEPYAHNRLRASLVDEAHDDGLRRAVHALVHAGR